MPSEEEKQERTNMSLCNQKHAFNLKGNVHSVDKIQLPVFNLKINKDLIRIVPNIIPVQY